MTHTGHDIFNCGYYSNPCQLIRYAVRTSITGDTILVDYAGGRPYKECESNSAISIPDSLSIRGVNFSAEIQCRQNTTLFLVQERLKVAYLILHNLTLSNSEVAVNSLQNGYTNVVFSQCVLRDNSFGISIKKAAMCSLVLNNLSFYNHESAGIELFLCKIISFRITNTSFYSSQL